MFSVGWCISRIKACVTNTRMSKKSDSASLLSRILAKIKFHVCSFFFPGGSYESFFRITNLQVSRETCCLNA